MIWRLCGAQVPIQTRHHLQSFFKQLWWQVFIGRMLRTAWIRMGHPNGFQAQHVGEDVIGQRSAQIWQDGRFFLGGALQGVCSPGDPGVIGVNARCLENFVAGGRNLHIAKAMTVQVSAQSAQDV